MKSPALLTRRHFARMGVGTLGFTAIRLGAAVASGHRFLCCDYQGNKVAIVSSEGAVEWEATGPNP